MKKIIVFILLALCGNVFAQGPPPSWPGFVKSTDGTYIYNERGDSVAFYLSGLDTFWISAAGLYWEPATILNSARLDSIINMTGRYHTGDADSIEGKEIRGTPSPGDVVKYGTDSMYYGTDLTGGGGGGMTDDGTVVRLTDINDSMGIGTTSPARKLDVEGWIRGDNISTDSVIAVALRSTRLRVSSVAYIDSIYPYVVGGAGPPSNNKLQIGGTTDTIGMPGVVGHAAPAAMPSESLFTSRNTVREIAEDTADVIREEMGDTTLNYAENKFTANNTETGIAVTYQSGDSTIDYVVTLGTNIEDAEVDNNITIDEASDADTTGTKVAAALATRMDNTGDTVTGTYDLSGGSLQDIKSINWADSILALLFFKDTGTIVSDSQLTTKKYVDDNIAAAGGGDVTDVVGGDGLVDDGNTGSITVDVKPGFGITIVGDSVEVDTGQLNDDFVIDSAKYATKAAQDADANTITTFYLPDSMFDESLSNHPEIGNFIDTTTEDTIANAHDAVSADSAVKAVLDKNDDSVHSTYLRRDGSLTATGDHDWGDNNFKNVDTGDFDALKATGKFWGETCAVEVLALDHDRSVSLKTLPFSFKHRISNLWDFDFDDVESSRATDSVVFDSTECGTTCGVHPDVEATPNGWPVTYYDGDTLIYSRRLYMVQTPTHPPSCGENPTVYWSDDKENWYIPFKLDTLNDSIIYAPVPVCDGLGGATNTDPQIIVAGDGRMYLYWRWVDSQGADSTENIYVKSSANAVDWSDSTLLFSTNRVVATLSPAVLYDDDLYYRMWTIDKDSADNVIRVERSVTPDGFDYVKTTLCTLSNIPSGWYMWQFNIAKAGGLYVMVATMRNGSDYRNYLAKGYDGISWTFDDDVLTQGSGVTGSFDSVHVYTGDIVPRVIPSGYMFDYWYSGNRQGGVAYNIGYTTITMAKIDSNAVGSGQIVDGSIKEVDLNASVSPVTGDLMIYGTAGTNFIWKTKSELQIVSESDTVPRADTCLTLSETYGGADKVYWDNDTLFTIVSAGETLRTYHDGTSWIFNAGGGLTVLDSVLIRERLYLVMGNDTVAFPRTACSDDQLLKYSAAGDSFYCANDAGATFVWEDSAGHGPDSVIHADSSQHADYSDSTDLSKFDTDDLAEGSNKYDQALPDSGNWSTAYGWGDHSGQGYEQYDDSGSYQELPKSVINTKLYIGNAADTNVAGSLAVTVGNMQGQSYLTTETDPIWVSDSADYAFKTWVSATYAPLASPTFTGTVTIPTPFTLGAVSVIATGTELNYVDGVTSAIQTQLDGKFALSDFDNSTIDTTAGGALQVKSGGIGATQIGTNGVADDEIDYSAVTLADFDYQTAWQSFYSNADGDVTELAFGTSGKVLTSSGASSAPTWETPTGAFNWQDSAGEPPFWVDSSKYAVSAGGTNPFIAGNLTVTGAIIQFNHELNLDTTHIFCRHSDSYFVFTSPDSQLMHPSIVYIEGGKWGFEYWLALTPPQANNENPHIFVSHDAVTWQVFVSGTDTLKNPVITCDSFGTCQYLSDPDLVWAENGDLYLIFRVTRLFGTEYINYVYCIHTSNGIDWGDTVMMLDGFYNAGTPVSPDTATVGHLSPAINLDSAGQYTMYTVVDTSNQYYTWAIWKAPRIDTAWARAEADSLFLLGPTVNSDDTIWIGIAQWNLPGSERHYHGDFLRYSGGQIVGLIAAKNSRKLYMGISRDGEYFNTVGSGPLLEHIDSNWAEKTIYRPTGFFTSTDDRVAIKMFYCGSDSSDVWRTSKPTLIQFNPYAYQWLELSEVYGFNRALSDSIYLYDNHFDWDSDSGSIVYRIYDSAGNIDAGDRDTFMLACQIPYACTIDSVWMLYFATGDSGIVDVKFVGPDISGGRHVLLDSTYWSNTTNHASGTFWTPDTAQYPFSNYVDALPKQKYGIIVITDFRADNDVTGLTAMMRIRR